MSLSMEAVKTGSLVTQKISGFSVKELSELNSMDYREMKMVIWNALVSRKMLSNKTQIINAWVNGNDVFIETKECSECQN